MSTNPKLNNVLKGWRAAAHQWIIIADSNVLMPRDYIQRLFANWRADTGLVASPPVGCRPDGFWAGLECAFLNTYQARWQYLADAFGFGFAQGKTMLWRRADLERAGGIAALAEEVAEDAAATKIVRGAGLQGPAGRSAAGAAARPAQRRRSLESASALGAAAPRELLLAISCRRSCRAALLPMIAVAIVAGALGISPPLSVRQRSAAFWYGGEMLLAAAAGWHAFAVLSRLRVWPAICCCRCFSSARCTATASSGAATTCRSSACGTRAA